MFTHANIENNCLQPLQRLSNLSTNPLRGHNPISIIHLPVDCIGKSLKRFLARHICRTLLVGECEAFHSQILLEHSRESRLRNFVRHLRFSIRCPNKNTYTTRLNSPQNRAYTDENLGADDVKVVSHPLMQFVHAVVFTHIYLLSSCVL